MLFKDSERIKQTLRDAAYHALRDAISEGLPPVGIAALTKGGRIVTAGPIAYGERQNGVSSFETADQAFDTALRAMFAEKAHMPNLDEVLAASFRVEAALDDPYSLEKRTEKFVYAPS